MKDIPETRHFFISTFILGNGYVQLLIMIWIFLKYTEIFYFECWILFKCKPKCTVNIFMPGMFSLLSWHKGQSAYHHSSCEFESHSWWGVLDTTLCDKVCQWFAICLWFSTISSTNKTEILLKMALNTIIPNPLDINWSFLIKTY
jgi:hypothetical protein